MSRTDTTRRWTLHRGSNSWAQTGPLLAKGETVEVVEATAYERAITELHDARIRLASRLEEIEESERKLRRVDFSHE